GSKVVFAAYGDPQRELATAVPDAMKHLAAFENILMVMPGIITLQMKPFTTYENEHKEMAIAEGQLKPHTASLTGIVFIVITDNAGFVSNNLRNFLWA